MEDSSRHIMQQLYLFVTDISVQGKYIIHSCLQIQPRCYEMCIMMSNSQRRCHASGTLHDQLFTLKLQHFL